MSTIKPARVAIIGGGISGLSAAYFLENSLVNDKLKVEIDLFEADSQLGGKINTLQQDGLNLELGAESFLSRKAAGIEFCRALGIAEDLLGTRPENKKTFIWHADQMHRLPEGLTGFVPGKLSSLFSTSLLSLAGKLRVAGDYFIPARKSGGDESLASFMIRRLGRQAYQRLVQPLLCGIYAGDGNELSLEATYPELRKLELEHGSLIRGLKRRQRKNKSDSATWPPFVTLPGGMSALIEAAKGKLNNTEFHLRCPIGGLRPDHKEWRLEVRNSELSSSDKAYDVIIVSSSAHVTSSIVAPLATDLSALLNSIPHVSTATVNQWHDADKLEHSLDGYGFVIPAEEQNGVTAVTWTSSKHFNRAPSNMRLIRTYLGRAGAELDTAASDEEIMNIVSRELERTMGISCQCNGFVIQRWPKGSPQYTLGHPEKLNQIEQQLKRYPGLYLCGSSYRGVGIPDCIRDGQMTAEKVAHYLTD